MYSKRYSVRLQPKRRVRFVFTRRLAFLWIFGFLNFRMFVKNGFVWDTHAAQIALDSVFGDMDAQREQVRCRPCLPQTELATGAFGTPYRILLCHLLNQCDGLRCDFGLCRFEFELTFSKEAKACAMPTEEGFGFEEQRTFLQCFRRLAKSKNQKRSDEVRCGGLEWRCMMVS